MDYLMLKELQERKVKATDPAVIQELDSLIVVVKTNILEMEKADLDHQVSIIDQGLSTIHGLHGRTDDDAVRCMGAFCRSFARAVVWVGENGDRITLASLDSGKRPESLQP